ncbi:pyridoxamine 5'-phosphate oxidase family protein [Arthrobacter sp. MYb211]|uniref:pyridoxamine 5'-phosphate oxidase family protein n=1 Tax=Micrococcaceae TaxID=1268 RepID=UPI000BB8160F|nr:MULTISPECIES: pyridoxamine 5'-phosphate oxidase family protein [Micrococcaceae]PCC27185.1 flavin-nucleotide-binding protein [Glutamicibacter sp. BW80]PQZ97356.1 pyridoxamine 5'-phosphate oxidase family protein [Arthrobacter sp. MYb224]PRA00855.1 pyridoxamine 5'-phosphate oxidase family protein [Arthrobacter sp. MYb229]PRA10803.1 pyridoxamine 5'-phosphate oxidase family protein [Arthrobacter sp. MYb221]PRB48789.1 pyridoxamine 5'-phosphate oxidase family protein [Arthrobacter sp. MYb216]
MRYQHTNDAPVLVLTEEQSWELLAHTAHGRIATAAAGTVDIVPVNYAVHKGNIYLRTAPGNKLASMVVNSSIALEADGILSDEAWSVVVHGTAEILEHEADINEALESGVSPWAQSIKDFWIRVTVNSISGRHFILGEQPEAI